MEDHPFAREAIEWRQSGDRRGADQEQGRGPRHPLDETPHLLHVARAGRLQDCARAEEQETLERGVIDRVVQRRCQRQDGEPGHAAGPEHEPDAEGDADDADVLDAAVRQKSLQVVLDEGREDAPQGGRSAQRQEQAAPPGRPTAEEVEADAQETVDPQLDHDARHQRRHVTRCFGVGPRQPDVQGHEAGFRSEPEQGEEEDDIARPGWQARGDLANLDEGRPRGLCAQKPQGGRDQGEAGVRHPGVPAAGAQALAGVAVADHQEVRSERHPLPGEQEREDVGGQDDETHAEQEQGEHHAGEAPASGRVAAGRVLERVDRRRRADEADHEEKRGAQCIETENEGEIGKRRRELQSGRAFRHERQERRDRCRHGSTHDQGHPPPTTRPRQGQQGRPQVAASHHEERADHGIGRCHARPGRRSSAFRMPRRMSTGSGGQPSTNRSTGTTRSTLPAIA